MMIWYLDPEGSIAFYVTKITEIIFVTKKQLILYKSPCEYWVER